MRKTILVTFSIFLSLKICAQQDDLLNWLVPAEYTQFSHTLYLSNPNNNIPDDSKIFFSNKSETLVFDLKGKLISKLPFATRHFGKGKWIIHNSRDGSLIFNMDTQETMKTDYREITACGNNHFMGRKQNYDHQLFKWNNSNVILECNSGDHFDVYKSFIKKVDAGYNRETIYTIYNLEGDSLFTSTDCTLLVLSSEHGIFEKMYNYPITTKVVDRNGKILTDLCDDCGVTNIGTGLYIYGGEEVSYLDYKGNKIEGSVHAKTKHKNVMVIESSDHSKKGLYFEAQEKSTEIMYTNFTFNPESILAYAENEDHYYSYNGKLLYKTDDTYSTNLINNKYLLEYNRCRILDFTKNPIVSQNSNIKCTNCGCTGGVLDFQNKEYFWIKDREDHLFVWNEKQQLIHSFTDDKYKSVSLVCGHLILNKRKDRLKSAGLVSMKNNKLIFPHHYVKIATNKYEENDKREYIILHKVGGFSLYHIPTKQMVLEGYSILSFISKNLVAAMKDKSFGLAKLKK